MTSNDELIDQELKKIPRVPGNICQGILRMVYKRTRQTGLSPEEAFRKAVDNARKEEKCADFMPIVADPEYFGWPWPRKPEVNDD